MDIRETGKSAEIVEDSAKWRRHRKSTQHKSGNKMKRRKKTIIELS